jgi:hypothetical protein
MAAHAHAHAHAHTRTERAPTGLPDGWRAGPCARLTDTARLPTLSRMAAHTRIHTRTHALRSCPYRWFACFLGKLNDHEHAIACSAHTHTRTRARSTHRARPYRADDGCFARQTRARTALPAVGSTHTSAPCTHLRRMNLLSVVGPTACPPPWGGDDNGSLHSTLWSARQDAELMRSKAAHQAARRQDAARKQRRQQARLLRGWSMV